MVLQVLDEGFNFLVGGAIIAIPFTIRKLTPIIEAVSEKLEALLTLLKKYNGDKIQ